ncbi:MAG: DNA replication/repair protein RecF [Deltaproteobacteria bacterium]|nr:DNA replication/repair protein RecF [Deltaproteobacteria bacterium]
MRLSRFRARRFRNLGPIDLRTDGAIHVFWGENAQGKTNLLEGIYLLSNLRSFRTGRLSDLIAWGAEDSDLEAEVQGPGGAVQLRLNLERRGRIVRVNDKAPESTASYLSEFATVLFSPLDLELSQGNQEMRRSYVDRAAFVARPGHLAALRRYNRTLRQRNVLLRVGGAELEAWDESLALAGEAVARVRREVAEEIGPKIADFYGRISAGREELGLRWETPYLGSAGGLWKALVENRERDRAAGFTSVGPHRDLLQVLLDGRPLRTYGSRGQQRSAALSFKLALLLWGRERLGQDPVFLLDDPGSELDAGRLGFLGEFVADWKGQAFIACTDRESFPLPGSADVRTHRVVAGQVR